MLDGSHSCGSPNAACENQQMEVIGNWSHNGSVAVAVALSAKTATGLAKISELTRQKRHLDESWRVKLAKIDKWEMDFHAYFEAH